MRSQSNKFTKLEAIRGFAAIYVVLHHSFSKDAFMEGIGISFLFRFGQEAVILFFILSGFVIQYAYTKSPDKSFRTFILKRFLRIYIPLIFVFTANYLLVAISNNRSSIDWWVLFGNILMLQDTTSLKPNVICGPFLGNLPLWSLSYEWWFYILFIIVASKIKSGTSKIIYIAGTIATFTYLFFPNFLNRILMYLVIWWVGADIAKLYLNKANITFTNLKGPLVALALNIVLLVINVLINGKLTAIGVSPLLELRHFSFALFAVIIAIHWKKMKWIGFNGSLGLFEPIASISFGIYISHYFLVSNAHYLDHVIGGVYFKFVIYLIVCILFSFLVERVIYIHLNRYLLNKYVSKAAASKG
jgi:peptidoglycan/LPS O-acetylase OafA/YrhL